MATTKQVRAPGQNVKKAQIAARQEGEDLPGRSTMASAELARALGRD